MLLRIRTDVLAATFLAVFVLEVAASPSPYAGFAVDDVRRPVYRGSTRYKRHLLLDLVNADFTTTSFDKDLNIFQTNLVSNRSNEEMPLYNVINKRDIDRTLRNIGHEQRAETAEKLQNQTTARARELSSNDSSEDVNWEFVPLASSLPESDNRLVNNFFKNSLRIFKSHTVGKISTSAVNSSAPPEAKYESLDKLILSHTDGKLPIQMYPEIRPQEWNGKPKDPTVIVIEDVHPSKLPKPDSQWGLNRPFDYPKPQTPSRPHNNYYTPQYSNNYGGPPRPVYMPGSWGSSSQRPPPQNGKPPVILVENVALPSSPPPQSHWGHYPSEQVYDPDVWSKPTTPKPYVPIIIGTTKPVNSPIPAHQGSNTYGGQISVQIVTTTATKPTISVVRPIASTRPPNHNNAVYKPLTLKPKPSVKPKPTRPSLVKPVEENYIQLPTVETTAKPPKIKPQHSNAKPITVKPLFLHPKPQKPIKRPSQNNPLVVPSDVPAYYGVHGVNQDCSNSSYASTTQATLEATISAQNNWPSLRPVYHYPSITTQRPVQSTPIYVTHNRPLVAGYGVGGGHLGHKPVYSYPRPSPSPEPPPRPLVPIHPPLNESPRPPEAPYRDPPIKPNHPLGSAIIISQTTSLPPVTPPAPIRPPPPSIIILESEPEPPPIIEDCGTIQIVNKDVKSEKSCSDVLILLNSPLAISQGSSAAASGSSSIAAAGGASVAAGAAAAGAAGTTLAAGAAGATLAAGSAGIAALGGATASNSILSSGNSQGSSGSNSGVNIPQAIAPVSPASPVLHPIEDETSSEEDYDYSNEDNNNPTSPSSTSRPPTKPSSSSITLMDYLSSFSSALPFVMGPFSVSVGIVMMGPLLFLLFGAFAVGSFIIPWFLPRIFFGRRRRRRRSSSGPSIKLPDSAYLFLENLKSGYFSIYD